MAKLIQIEPNKTYATRENVEKAVAKHNVPDEFRYFIHTHTDGRFFPVFLGGEKAIQAGLHFHFHVVG